MGLLLFVLLLVVPIAELWIFFEVADQIGFLITLVLLFFVSIAGAWLLKQQGMSTWRRMQDSLQRGDMPAKEVTDGALILLGGALLLTPGFLTDAVGLLLLFPVTRVAIKGAVRALLAKRIRSGFVVTEVRTQRVHQTRVVKVERTKRSKSSSETPSSQLPSPGPPDDEDGSPDTR
jgi:UPF0716 protein FxsA